MGRSELQGWEGRHGEVLNQSLTDFEKASEESLKMKKRVLLDSGKKRG